MLGNLERPSYTKWEVCTKFYHVLEIVHSRAYYRNLGQEVVRLYILCCECLLLSFNFQ